MKQRLMTFYVLDETELDELSAPGTAETIAKLTNELNECWEWLKALSDEIIRLSKEVNELRNELKPVKNDKALAEKNTPNKPAEKSPNVSEDMRSNSRRYTDNVDMEVLSEEVIELRKKERIVNNGKFGRGLEWMLDKYGELIIFGNGEMRNFEERHYPENSDRPWSPYTELIKKCLIKNGVMNISANAFLLCENLTYVSIANSVSIIGRQAFCNCKSLRSIDIPDSVSSIGNAAFKNCTNLKSITIPKNVTAIGYDAFENCYNLVIKCHNDSHALEHALDYGIKYEIIV